MKLILFGKEIDSTKEHEIFAEAGKGFEIEITFKDKTAPKLILLSYTEVHHLYRSDRIAFESGIKSEGCNLSTEDIECVEILNNHKQG